MIRFRPNAAIFRSGTKAAARRSIHRQSFQPHNFQGIGGWTGTGTQRIVKYHFPVGHFFSEVTVGDAGNRSWVAINPVPFWPIRWRISERLPISLPRLLVTLKISSIRKSNGKGWSARSAFSSAFNRLTSV